MTVDSGASRHRPEVSWYPGSTAHARGSTTATALRPRPVGTIGDIAPRHPGRIPEVRSTETAPSSATPADAATVDALPAGALRLGDAVVRAGCCSWADRSLVRDGGFYPRATMTARERLAYYAGQFALAEVATTYRFPPTPQLCAQWAERTPPGFALDVRAWSLLTGAPTLPDSLWSDLQTEVPADRRDRRRLYAGHLPAAVLEECWARFRHALQPLADAGRLGAVLLRYPSWWGPRQGAWAELDALRRRLPGLRVAVELPADRWFAGDSTEATLEWLDARGIGLVCVDGPPRPGADPGPSVVAATSELAVVRFVGRRCCEGDRWSRPYRYDRGELDGWVPAVADLASSSGEVHLLFDNCHRGDSVDNARMLLDLLGDGSQGDRHVTEACTAEPW